MRARRSDVRITEDIASRLRHTRQAIGVNQRQFAKRANLRQNRYNQYESDARTLKIDAAQKICKEYGITLDWLFRGNPSMLPHGLAIEIERIETAERGC